LPLSNNTTYFKKLININRDLGNMGDFVDIIGYEGLYKINRNGDVWGCKRNRLMKPTLNSIGYLIVRLRKNNKGKNKYIHRLLALQFIPNPENLPVIDHIDMCKTNNNIENLRWVSLITNANNKTKHKTNKSGFKHISTRINKSENEYWAIRINIENFNCQLSYNKSKYTLEQVVEFRNKIYIDNNIQQYD
jgi:hypothetical protein